MNPFRTGMCVAVLSGLVACGETDPPELAEQPTVQVSDPCDFLEVSELRELFGRKVGPGTFKTLEAGVRQCAWSAGDLPDLIVQIQPSGKGGVRGAATVGENFLVLDLPEMGADAAVSILNPSLGSGLDRTVGIVAVAVAGGVMRIAPLRLSIVDGSDEYQSLLKVAKAAAARQP